jgi:hypothetical protein
VKKRSLIVAKPKPVEHLAGHKDGAIGRLSVLKPGVAALGALLIGIFCP